jgi:hypothetical protein
VLQNGFRAEAREASEGWRALEKIVPEREPQALKASGH